jgi:hypothetical protein
MEKLNKKVEIISGGEAWWEPWVSPTAPSERKPPSEPRQCGLIRTWNCDLMEERVVTGKQWGHWVLGQPLASLLSTCEEVWHV